ncbi:mannose-1-phosphate guanylyltransferase [Phycisphaerales bacterium]|nr:mannose-1-phosphate guanylyltransferase [Phycisphaerales bacterium]
MRYAMIMAGGAGTRLWPMSRKDRPKQLLAFIQRPGMKAPVSLLELADRRLDGLIERKGRYICTSESYRAAVREQLSRYDEEHVLGEPVGRDTVNAVGFAAAVLAKEDEDAVFCVLTGDHVIEPEDIFRERMDLGFRLVENDPRRFVTFSIKPTYPATGFGYVERGTPIRDARHGKHPAIDGVKEHAYHVARFVEKPDYARAQVYVQSGDFGWNSGMFVWKASTVLEALEKFKPESFEGLMKIQAAWGTKKARSVINEVYPTLPKISVDYALMEPASQAARKGGKEGERFSVCTVQMDLTWLDVGSWPSFAETVSADKMGHRFTGDGTPLVVGGKNNLVVSSKGHTVALLGCEDLIVVQTPDATLVMPRARAEELKNLHAQVDEKLK